MVNKTRLTFGLTSLARLSTMTLRKKISLGLLATYATYLATGLLLTYWGAIPRLYFLPGWSIKPPNSDRSTLAADGPLISYTNGRAVVRQIHRQAGAITVKTDTLEQPDQHLFSCFVEETGQRFSFRLHPLVDSLPYQYKAPDKMLVISDIEGNFKGLQLLLRKTGVVDSHLQWQFGTGHLVFVGDLFDRGIQVTECLWLLYKLEDEAHRAGGQLHFILGNHDQMNLTGHYKYVRRKYNHNADTLQFAYGQWYGSDTELGRWLRNKNVIEQIGEFLFVHGGLSPALVQQRLPLARINQLARQSLDPTRQRNSSAAYRLVGFSSQQGPTWYRGMAQQELPAQQVKAILRQYGAKHLIVGHTPVEQIESLYDNRIILIDLPHQQTISEGFMQALWIEHNQMYCWDTRSGKHHLL